MPLFQPALPVELLRSAYDNVSGSGALQGQITDSGHTWVVSGTGSASCIINGDHIEGTANTYCMIDTGAPIRKISQTVSGHVCTIACMLNANSLSDMVHLNLIGGSAPHVLYWKTGTGSALAPAWEQIIANVPTMSDESIHTFEMEIIDDYIFGYADGDLIIVAYHPDFSSVVGNSFFAQLHDATTGNASVDDKIYEVAAYTKAVEQDADNSPIEVPSVKAKTITVRNFQMGNPLGAGFSPVSDSYFHTENINGHVFGGNLNPIINVKGTVAGTGARLRLSPTSGSAYQFEIFAQGDATAIIKHSANTRFSFPPNTNTVSIPGATVVGGSAVNANAILDVQSTTKAFMPPRMTTTQKNAIASPTAGMVVYDSDLAKLCVYTTTWETITSA